MTFIRVTTALDWITTHLPLLSSFDVNWETRCLNEVSARQCKTKFEEKKIRDLAKEWNLVRGK